MKCVKNLKLNILGVLVFLVVGPYTTLADESQVASELDAYWAELSRTVAEGDFSGYANTYHPDAVLVNQSLGTSYPISTALDGWKQGFVDTNAGNTEASVEFRFTQLLADETTAHQTGIFHYTAKPADGELTDSYIHFEALLTKKDGWKMMMEYQQSSATVEEWAAAK